LDLKNVFCKDQYEGAYVKEPKPGMYKSVVGFDLDGLYPHIIMMYNLGPEKLLNPELIGDEFYRWYSSQSFGVNSFLNKEIDTSILQKYDVCITPNGQIFSRKGQSFFGELMELMYADRKKFKDKMISSEKKLQKAETQEEKNELVKKIAMYKNFQSAKKVTLNSAYGAIGNQYFRFFDVRIAEAVTTSGQLAILWIQKAMNEFLNCIVNSDKKKDYIIASDTDSMYLNLEEVMPKLVENYNNKNGYEKSLEIDKFCEKTLQPFIQKSFKELYEYMFAFANKMNMKREAISDMAIWTAKKHYLMNVWNMEGVQYDKAKLKVVGLEAVKSSSYSVYARNKLKEAYKLIIEGNVHSLRNFRDKYFEEFKNLSVEGISIPRTCNNLQKYHDDQNIWGFKTPMHVKGALVYNKLLKEFDLTKKYPSIKEGEKVRYVYLKEPNPLHCNAISFPHILPVEFDIYKFVSYNTQFEKSFVDPINSILNVIGWSLEDSGSLFD